MSKSHREKEKTDPPTRDDPLSEFVPYTSSDLTYNDYLKVPELLQLQQLLSDPHHHDEMLFIIIHQAYELWFKLILHEMEKTIQLMGEKKVLQARHFVKRIVEILRLLIPQIHILETMRPVDFLQFRDHLKPASGFQSLQFREVEFLAGLKDSRYLRFFKDRPNEYNKLEDRLNQTDLRTAYYQLLSDMDFDIPPDITLESLDADMNAQQQLIDALMDIYQNPNDKFELYLLSESLVDFDEYLSLWRDHHVRVVARVIGYRPGTGGSSGVDYLQTTTAKQCFPYLWQVRTHLEK